MSRLGKTLMSLGMTAYYGLFTWGTFWTMGSSATAHLASFGMLVAIGLAWLISLEMIWRNM